MTARTYTAYGLAIQSEVALSSPPIADSAAPDIVIRYGNIIGDHRPPKLQHMLEVDAETITVYWPDAGAYRVHQGREITIDRDENANEQSIADWLQSGALSLALHQRRLFVLHASAVVIDGQAIAFAGEVGQGKSTTASAFHAAGHSLLTDDLVVIDSSGERPLVLPGFPHVKLLNETAAHFGVDPDSLQPLQDDRGKGLRRLQSGFHDRSIPLGAVCFLEDGASLALSPLPPQLALVNLMRHAFVARLTEFLDSTKTTHEHFRACTTIVQRSQLLSLARPRDLKQLPELVHCVRQHVAQQAKAA